jgi:hypothetical protein
MFHGVKIGTKATDDRDKDEGVGGDLGTLHKLGIKAGRIKYYTHKPETEVTNKCNKRGDAGTKEKSGKAKKYYYLRLK